jgi:hypothetical protein
MPFFFSALCDVLFRFFNISKRLVGQDTEFAERCPKHHDDKNDFQLMRNRRSRPSQVPSLGEGSRMSQIHHTPPPFRPDYF